MTANIEELNSAKIFKRLFERSVTKHALIFSYENEIIKVLFGRDHVIRSNRMVSL